jgi:3-isopropylmalate/(R)-2-methylmalate dehydratase small subunit
MVRINLKKQLFSLLPDGETVTFEINPYKKECLIKGLDDIDYLTGIRDVITAFEFRNTLKYENRNNGYNPEGR